MSRIRRSTMNDVAREAGVSQTTVSFVLNDIDAGLPEHTRQRVLEAARRLSYTPNEAARRLASRKSHSLGLAVYDIIDIVDYQQAAAPVVASVFRAAERRGYRMIIYTTHERAESGLDIQTYFAAPVLSREVEGVVIWDYYVDSDKVIASFQDGLPIALLDRQEGDVPCVVPDYMHGVREVVNSLVESGRRRLCLIGRSRGFLRDLKVRSAFNIAAGEAGLPPSAVTVIDERVPLDVEEDTTEAAIEQLLALPERPDALVCAYDRTAMAALVHLRERGVRIPEDMAIVGCVGLTATSHPAFRLSTLDLRFDLIGMHAVDMVLRMTSGEQLAGAKVMVRPEYIRRATS